MGEVVVWWRRRRKKLKWARKWRNGGNSVMVEAAEMVEIAEFIHALLTLRIHHCMNGARIFTIVGSLPLSRYLHT